MHTLCNKGFSAVAAVIIAAVVIGGGVAAVSITGDGNADADNDQQATTSTNAEADSEASSDQQAVETTFQCEDDQATTLRFTGGSQADLTLPNGEVVAVSRTEREDGTVFQDTEGSVVLRNTQEGAVVEQDGEVVASGCVASSTRAYRSGSEASSSVNVEAESNLNTEAESEAETEVNTTPNGGDTEIEGSAETDVQVDVGADTQNSTN